LFNNDATLANKPVLQKSRVEESSYDENNDCEYNAPEYTRSHLYKKDLCFSEKDDVKKFFAIPKIALKSTRSQIKVVLRFELNNYIQYYNYIKWKTVIHVYSRFSQISLPIDKIAC